MRALILAAGEGTRLRPLTLDRPKPMLPVGGRPILEHLVLLLRDHGIREISINLHYKPEVITGTSMGAVVCGFSAWHTCGPTVRLGT